jgi:hypothetical protein
VYRLFLLRQGKIVAHHEFRAEDDARACRGAALAFDACADYCDEFEVWYGVRLLTSSAGLKVPTSGAAEDSPEEAATAAMGVAIAGMAAEILEGAMRTNAALRDSPTVNARLNALRRPSGGLH